MAEFEIRGKMYDHTPLDAITQLHCSRKGAPLFIGLANREWFNVLYDMPQEDIDQLISLVMPFVKRQDISGQWSKIYLKEHNRFVYDDITGYDILTIITNVLMDYLPDFIKAAGLLVYGTPMRETTDTQDSTTI